MKAVILAAAVAGLLLGAGVQQIRVSHAQARYAKATADLYADRAASAKALAEMTANYRTAEAAAQAASDQVAAAHAVLAAQRRQAAIEIQKEVQAYAKAHENMDAHAGPDPDWLRIHNAAAAGANVSSPAEAAEPAR